MYYQPCSLCSRKIAEINLTGCTRCRHAPAPEAVLAAQQAHRERVRNARHREAEENALLSGGAVIRATGIVYAESEASDADVDHPDTNSSFGLSGRFEGVLSSAATG